MEGGKWDAGSDLFYRSGSLLHRRALDRQMKCIICMQQRKQPLCPNEVIVCQYSGWLGCLAGLPHSELIGATVQPTVEGGGKIATSSRFTSMHDVTNQLSDFECGHWREITQKHTDARILLACTSCGAAYKLIILICVFQSAFPINEHHQATFSDQRLYFLF